MKKALMIQLSIPRANPLEYKANVHLAPGYLKAFAMTRCPDWEIEIMPRVYTDCLNVRAVISYICSSGADLVCFSTYLWNIDKTLHIASEVLKIYPSQKILFGGPEVNSDNQTLLADPSFTVGISGEGEIPFVDYLNEKPYDEISGLIYKKDGKIIANPVTACRPPLTVEENPYILNIIETKPDETLFFETIRGCPFRCRFCYYNKLYDNIIHMSEDYIRAMMRKAREGRFTEVFLLDPSFNVQPHFDRILDIIAEENPDNQLEIHTEMRADLLTYNQLERLVELNFKGIEVGLQTTNPKALELMNRTQDLNKLTINTRMLIQKEVNCKVDLIVGLPGDTLEGFKKSCDYVRKYELHQDIQVFQLSVLPGTYFSINSNKYGLEYTHKSPYYVLNLPDFSRKEMKEAFNYASEVFEINFDPVSPSFLATDFTGIEEDRPVFFDSDVYPVHKLLIESFSHPPEKHISELAESCALHFRVKSVYEHIDEILKPLQNLTAMLPFNCFEIIIEAEEMMDPDFLMSLTAAVEINYEHFVNRDIRAFYPDDEQITTRLTVVLPEKCMSERGFPLLSTYAEVYLIVTDLEPLHIEQLLTAGYGLYFKGDMQALIFDFLKHGEMLSDFTLFESYLFEQLKYEAWEDGSRFYWPNQVEI
ncbi:MAG: radical SAM protein [Candidatus Cloacimonetes bacterium]|nr:radical SAM protein [Candidatus Cloacimonadota bacterium]